MTILVIAEVEGGKPTRQTLELLALARGFADDVAAVTTGDANDLIAAGADRVWVAPDVMESGYVSDTWTATVTILARMLEPEAIFAAHTTSGTDLAPRLAFRLGGAVATGCIEATRDDGRLRFTRSLAGGNARETVYCAGEPAVATFRAGICAPLAPDSMRSGEIRALPIAAPAPERMRLIERERDTTGALRLEEARVVVAGGRGVNGADGFRLLEALAAVLGGAVGASRVACDLGWYPHSRQIGLTGKTITPALYVAVGISGASHHMAGCGRAQTIVAINNDPDAPIFREARLGAIGDAAQIVPALTAELARLVPQD